jgi:hypothetical protein
MAGRRSPMLRVRLLGRFSVELDDEMVDVPSRPAQSLLAYLILNAGIALRREKVAGLLWPESTEANARSNLRHALWRLRKALGASPQTGRDYFDADDITIAWSGSGCRRSSSTRCSCCWTAWWKQGVGRRFWSGVSGGSLWATRRSRPTGH